MRIPARAVIYSFCALSLICGTSSPSPSQEQNQAPDSSISESAASQASAESASLGNSSSKVHIFYTSQLFGYFRVPDVQPADSTTGCAAAVGPGKPDSPAAQAFDRLWKNTKDATAGAILVGTGNNLGPALWARQFAQPEQKTGNAPPAPAYQRTEKELFDWDPAQNAWVTNEYVAELEDEEMERFRETGVKPKPDPNSLLERLRQGEGFIPMDNAACFLRRAGYAAVVPGEYDFYYGPERLRQLARFLASDEEPLKKNGETVATFKPVQMLGANLVIETTWKSDHKPVGDSQDPPKFGPWTKSLKYAEPKDAADPPPSGKSKQKDKAKNVSSDTPALPTLLSPTDGAQVYPWFPGAELDVMDLSQSSWLLANLKQNKPRTRGALQNFLASELKREKEKPSSPRAETTQPASEVAAVAALDANYQKELNRLSEIVSKFPIDGLYLCGSFKRDRKVEIETNGKVNAVAGNPNDIVPPGNPENLKLPPGGADCKNPLDQSYEAKEPEVRIKGASVEFFYPFPNLTSFSTLLPGANYGLCLKSAALPAIKPKDSFYCARFSVFTPFFQFPTGRTQEDCKKLNQQCSYFDPQPYELAGPEDHPEQQVAIFGVVDPALGQDVGMLNLAWSNVAGEDDSSSKYKTQVAVEDPGEALQEIVGYFELAYEKSHDHHRFEGAKILLAQMAPGEAQKLATQVGGFDTVVSDADPELSGDQEERTAEWQNIGPLSGPKDYHAFLAVPQPYWVANKQPNEHVDLGDLTIETGTRRNDDGHPENKKFTSKHDTEVRPSDPEPGVPVNTTTVSQGRDWSSVNAPAGFWDAARMYVNSNCGRPSDPIISSTIGDASPDKDKESALQSLALCALQREIGADVVLLQKRDLYLDWQQRNPPKTFSSFQQFLDRVIWKGDFYTVLYVPGSTLQSVMKQSKAFDDDDKSLLSLSDETGRGLFTAGIVSDTNSGGYLINEVPLDTARVYTVATTDFIAAGDTGYPDLAANAIRKFVTPDDFDRQLKNVSAVVCRALQPASSCMDWIDRDSYFDELAVYPTDRRKGDTLGPQLWEWSIFDRKSVPGSTGPNGTSSKAEGVDAFVEERRVGSTRVNPPDTTLFALNDASLNLNMLDHKFSDEGLSNFVGNPTPQLSAKRSHAAGYDVQPKFLYSWHTRQFFENTEFLYNVQDTGNADAARTVSQKENLFSSDTGFAQDVNDRTLPHLEILGTFHYETQLVAPTSATLAPLPKPDTFAGTKFARAHYLLPRAGLRWEDRTSWIEAGLEDGAEIRAVRLVPPAHGTVFALARPNIPVSGAYWKWHFVVPFGQKVSWTVDEDGDYFFNEHADASTDTRFRSDTKTAINFQVFQNLSFAPTYEFFYYANKACPSCPPPEPKKSLWFWQNQASIQMKVRFDFWNGYRWWDQLRYKPPSGGSQ